MYVISLSSSRDRRSLIQSLIAAHYVCNKFIYQVHVTDEVSYKVLYQHIMYVISLSSSRDRRSLIQSLIAAHYVCNKFI